MSYGQHWSNLATSDVYIPSALDFPLGFNCSIFHFHTTIIFSENWIIHAIELKGLGSGFQFIA